VPSPSVRLPCLGVARKIHGGAVFNPLQELSFYEMGIKLDESLTGDFDGDGGGGGELFRRLRFRRDDQQQELPLVRVFKVKIF
jgi:hypothetical protein